MKLVLIFFFKYKISETNKDFFENLQLRVTGDNPLRLSNPGSDTSEF